MEKLWEPDIKNWKLITKDTADLIIKECEMGLDSKVKSLESITNRSDKLLAVYVPIITASAIYIFPNLKKIGFDYLITVSFLIFLLAAFGLYFCYQNAKHYTVNDLGYYPDKIFRSLYIDNDYLEKEKYIAMAIVVFRNIQARMRENDKTIAARMKNNVFALRILFFMCFTPFLGYLIVFLEFLLVSHF